MNIEILRSYCLSLKSVTEEFPFDSSTLVFKVAGKIFLLTTIDSPQFQFNVKCDPELAVQLRDQYNNVQPGYHMNKKHWNTITVDGSLTVKQLEGFIDDSYLLVQ